MLSLNFSMRGPGIFAGLWDPFRVQNYLLNNAKMLIEVFSALTLLTFTLMMQKQ